MFARLWPRATISVMMICALVGGGSAPARAASHLPSIDITPTAIYATSDNLTSGPNVAPVNGDIRINGSISFPLFYGTGVSYDHYSNGLVHNTLPRFVGANGQYVRGALDYRDIVDTIRLDASLFKGVGAELGTSYRHRTCCPGDTDSRSGGTASPSFYHDNYLGFSYTSPAFAALNGARLIYGITGHQSPHNSDNAATLAAAAAAGYNFAARRTMYGLTQAVTAAVPVDPKAGFSVAATYTWGPFNYFSNTYFPLYYGIWILNGTKRINKYVTFVANVDNFVQRPQGYPLGPIGNGGVNGASLNVGLDFHYAP